MTAKNKVLKGDVFVVPNPMICWGKTGIPMTWGDNVQQTQLKSVAKQLGCPVSPTRMFAQVWMTSPESNNWSNHGHKAVDKKAGWAPSYLPAKALYKAGENGKIRFSYDGIQFVLTVKTKNYRYKRFGDVKKCLETLKDRGMDYIFTPENAEWVSDKYGAPETREGLVPCKERW